MGICIERIFVFCASPLGIVSSDCEDEDFDTADDSPIYIYKY